MSIEDEWHLSKSVSISHIITTVALIVGMVIYVGDIKESVAVQGAEINNLKDVIDDKTAQHEEMFKRIDHKLDKLFEIIYKGKDD